MPGDAPLTQFPQYQSAPVVPVNVPQESTQAPGSQPYVGAIPGRGGALLTGIQAGMGMANNYTNERRNSLQYKQDQAQQRVSSDAEWRTHGGQGPNPAYPATESDDFLAHIAHGLAAVGRGVKNLVGGPGQPAIPPPAAGAAPVAAAPTQPQPLAYGGAVSDTASPKMDGNGVVQGGSFGLRGFEKGGAVSNQEPTAPAFMQPGSNLGPISNQPTILAFDQGGAIPAPPPAAAASPAPAPAQAAPAAAPPAQDPTAAVGPSAAAHIEAFHGKLMDAALDDQGQVKGKAGVPVNTQQAVTDAAQNTAAKAGVPEESQSSSNQPHSLTPEWWDDTDQAIAKAASAAAAAGHDGGQVANALYASRNAFFQGHILRNLSAANVALQNGDQKGVEAALKNVNYYLPNGQDLTTQKDADGNLTYQDPIHPTTQDGKPNMVPVDAAHIQMLGTAMLDPMNVNNLIMGARSAIAKQQLEAAQAQGEVLKGQGAFMRGSAAVQRAGTEAKLEPSHAYLNLSAADKDRAQVNWLRVRLDQIGKETKADPTLLRGAQDASTMFEDTAVGPKTVIPSQVPDPKHPGQMIPNMDPNAGKPTRDPTKVDQRLKGASAEDITGGKALAGDIYIANKGTLSPAQAAEYAAQAHAGARGTHLEGGKPVRNFKVDRANGHGWTWNPQTKSWNAFNLSPSGAAAAATGGTSPTPEDLAMTMSGSQSPGGIPSAPSGEAEDAE